MLTQVSGGGVGASPPPRSGDLDLAPAIRIPARRVNSPLATASVGLGALSWMFFGPLASIPAVVVGHMAQKQIRESAGALTGSGMATAGLVLGYLNLAVFALGALVFGRFVTSVLGGL